MKKTTYETHYMKNIVLLWSTIYEIHYMKNEVLLWRTIYETHYMKNKVLLWSTSVEKEIVALPFLCSFFWAFFGLSFFWGGGNALIMMIITLLLIITHELQLETRTRYDSIRMPPAVYRDMQWIKSDTYENYEGGLATNTMYYMFMQKAIWQK